MNRILILALVGVFSIAHAAGETGGIGLTLEFLFVLLLYPFVATGLSYFVFKATGKGWVFFLSPFFYMGLTMITSYDAGDPSSPPAVLSLLGAWLYWTHILGVAIIFPIFKKTNRAWMFFLAPVLNWILQILILSLFRPEF